MTCDLLDLWLESQFYDLIWFITWWFDLLLLRLWFTSTWFDLWLVETCFKSLLIFTSREQILVEWPTLVRVESLSFEADERELLLILAWLDRCTEHLTGVQCIWRKCTKCKHRTFSTCTLNFIDVLLIDLLLQVTWFVTWNIMTCLNWDLICDLLNCQDLICDLEWSWLVANSGL